MRSVIIGILLVASSCFGQSSKMFYIPTGNPFPVWQKYTLTAIANGTNGCANANGCWQVNGVLGANKTAGLTQDVTLFQLPANGFIHAVQMKTLSVFSGPTTLTATLGTTTSNAFYIVGLYNLLTAVSATNFVPVAGLPTSIGSTTSAAVNVVVGLIATIANVDQIVAGSSLQVEILWSVLP